jgi:oligopeptide transport system substrate-binding protein
MSFGWLWFISTGTEVGSLWNVLINKLNKKIMEGICLFKKNLALLLVLILAMGLLAGCGGKTEEPATTPTEPATPKVLVWNIGSSGPKTIDPGLNAASDGGNVINNMFEGLTREINGKIEPAMAESYTISDDGLVYTFKIRPDVKWSDGQPVTAKDFEYAWTRVLDPATASEYSWIFDEANVDSFKALDDMTFEVKLKVPTAYFLGLTAFYTFFPVREDAVAKGADGAWAYDPAASIVNGPFKLESYTQGNKLVLVKNDNYWRADEVKLTKIEGLLIDDESTSLTAFEAQEIDIIETVPTAEVPKLMAEDPRFMIFPQDAVYYYSLNTKVAPLDNVKVRQALALAIDRKAIVETVTKAGQFPAHSMVPATDYDADGNIFNVKSGFHIFKEDGTADVEKAKALLAEAGFADGKGFPEMELLYNTSEGHKAIAEAIQEMWKQNLGINVKLANQEWAVFQDTRTNHDFQIARGGWVGDYSDPMTYLGMFITGSTMNYGEWSSAAYDSAIAASKKLTDQARFDELYKADKVLMEEMPVIPIYYYTDSTMVQEYVKGWELTTRSTWYFGRADIEK